MMSRGLLTVRVTVTAVTQQTPPQGIWGPVSPSSTQEEGACWGTAHPSAGLRHQSPGAMPDLQREQRCEQCSCKGEELPHHLQRPCGPLQQQQRDTASIAQHQTLPVPNSLLSADEKLQGWTSATPEPPTGKTLTNRAQELQPSELLLQRMGRKMRAGSCDTPS